MHFRSHAQAYYAQWIRRYLEPGDQPWKNVADRWLATSIHGRGALLINNPPPTPTLPPHATYLRQCLISFSLLNMRQNTNVLTHTVQSEPIFNNWRFTIDIPPETKKQWIKHVELLRIHNAINATPPRIFTDAEMEVYTLTYAPLNTIGTGAQRAFSGSESACAFLRHAFGCFYNAFPKVDLEQKLFSTPVVFHKTLLSFRSAVLRYAQTIRILYLQRRYTTLRLKLPPPGIARPFQGPCRLPGEDLRL